MELRAISSKVISESKLFFFPINHEEADIGVVLGVAELHQISYIIASPIYKCKMLQCYSVETGKRNIQESKFNLRSY